jgi:DNA-binding NarL/FixJ family response regulator
MSDKTKVFLVDDHPFVREWLTTLINQQPDLTVCGEAGDVPGALTGIGQTEPSAVIADISLEASSGIELIKGIKARWPGMAVVVLSMHDEKLYAERAIRAGAQGFVMKSEATKKTIDALREVLQGNIFASPDILGRLTRRLVKSGAAPSTSPVEALSDRELEVFTMLGRGMETRRVADLLHISIKTVQVYCARIKQKLNLSNASELLREAVLWQERQQSGGG